MGGRQGKGNLKREEEDNCFHILLPEENSFILIFLLQTMERLEKSAVGFGVLFFSLHQTLHYNWRKAKLVAFH